MSKPFPSGFLWGAATSAHQVEGGNHNSWSRWEETNAERLAAEAPKSYGFLPNWPQIKVQAIKPANYVSGKAADHWNRYEADFDLMQELNLNAYRLSIEWSRVEPKEGQFDSAAIAHYAKMITALRDRGIEPLVTLWHWPLPLWLDNRGGWLASDAVSRFAVYVRRMAEALPEVKFWLTLNEPEVFAGNSYFVGVWPPGRHSFIDYLGVRRQLVLAHRAAYDTIKQERPEAQVGVAVNLTWFEGGDALGGLAARLADWWSNRRFLDAAGRRLDFIGLNHYFHNRFRGFKQNQNDNHQTSDLGWELLPEAIYHVLMDLRSRHLPVYITENGLADAADTKRGQFVRQTLEQVHRAITDGVDVRGYLHWSLLDNFEWDKGLWPRFGLIEVDFKTQKRTIRASARAYAKIAKLNTLD